MKIFDINRFMMPPIDSGGKIRVYELLRCAAEEGHMVDVLSLVHPKKLGLKNYIQGVRNIKINDNMSFRYAINYLSSIEILSKVKLLSPVAYSPMYGYIKSGYADYFTKKDYDIYQFSTPTLSSWYKLVPNSKPIVYSSQNVEYDTYKLVNESNLFSKYYLKKTFEVEKAALESASHVIACSNEDKNTFIDRFNIKENKISIIKNGYNDNKFMPALDKKISKKRLGFEEDEKLILFSGSNYIHNHRAVDLIIKNVLPNLDKKTKILIVGTVGNKYKSLSIDKMLFTGRVNDVVPYFQASDLAINPMVSGSGSNLKILEYLATGLPVISTEFGMRGFDDLKEFVETRQVEDFSRGIYGIKPVDREVDKVLDGYKWKNLTKDLLRVYEKL